MVHTYLISPESRMDVLTSEEIDDLVNSSDLVKNIKMRVDKRICLRNFRKRMEQAAEVEKK